MRLILIEDNHRLADSIRLGLEPEGFTIDCFDTLASARAALEGIEYSLILLDLGMPDGDGVTLIGNLRRSNVTIPILIIRARDGVGDRIRGLYGGADDYLMKPFANVQLDTITREVRVADKIISMPPREVALLEKFLRHIDRVVTNGAIDSALYSLNAEVTPNAIDTAVSRLRRRLSGAGADIGIHTAHGIGYMLQPPDVGALE